jgi:hypothetical protein
MSTKYTKWFAETAVGPRDGGAAISDYSKWRTFAFVLVIAAAFNGCVNRQRSPIGGSWEIVTETSGIPEAGGHHPFLHRNSERVKVRVDTDTYGYRFIPPDAMLWIGMDNGGLWIATGDHEPLLLQAGFNGMEPVPASDPLDLGLLGKHPVAELVQLAAKQPLLTSGWKPRERVRSSPKALPE